MPKPIIGFNEESLRAHNISHEQVYEAMRDPMRRYFDMDLSKDGHLRRMMVGSTFLEALVEVGFEDLPDQVWVFHAQPCSPEYDALYTRQIAKELNQ